MTRIPRNTAILLVGDHSRGPCSIRPVMLVIPDVRAKRPFFLGERILTCPERSARRGNGLPTCLRRRRALAPDSGRLAHNP